MMSPHGLRMVAKCCLRSITPVTRKPESGSWMRTDPTSDRSSLFTALHASGLPGSRLFLRIDAYSSDVPWKAGQHAEPEVCPPPDLLGGPCLNIPQISVQKPRRRRAAFYWQLRIGNAHRIRWTAARHSPIIWSPMVAGRFRWEISVYVNSNIERDEHASVHFEPRGVPVL